MVATKSPLSSVKSTKLDLPFYCKVVGDGEVTGDNDIVKVDVLTHGPQLKAHGCNWDEAKEWSVIFKVSRVVNLPGSPLALRNIHTYIIT